MTFGDSIKTCLAKYATFSGRASRSEYWWFQLFVLLVVCASGLILELLAGIAQLLLFLPGLAAGCRRLHDTGRTGWWLLLLLIPVIGWIILFIFFVESSKVEGDRYGPGGQSGPSPPREPMRSEANRNTRPRTIGTTRER